MAVDQVICTNKALSGDRVHEHISHLGLGTNGAYYSRITVAEAISQLRSPQQGDRYFTVSPSTGTKATVIEGIG